MLLIGASAAYAQVGDAGFEGSGAGPWIVDDWAGPWQLNFDATDQVHSGSQSLRLMANGTNDAGFWEKAEAKQLFAITPGQSIDGSVWASWANLSGSTEVKLEVKWLNAGLSELAGGLGVERKLANGDPATSAGWQFFDLSTWSLAERTAPAGAAFADMRLLILAAGDANTATGTAWFDDASFAVIPEPSTVALFGMGLAGLVGTLIHRRKKS
jgi:hypothetical protein